jgi:purine nucleosidase
LTRPSVIIDCDPGVDDGVALLLAFAATDALDILAVTTVAGNVGAELTARNACIIREIAGREDVPVHTGCERPLQREPIEAGHFHGESGLGSLPLREPRVGANSRQAVDFLIATLEKAGERSISLVATGPLTNLATALTQQPAIRRAISEIALMGGARSEGGNITASAEYNIYADPHAAQLIFTLDVPIVAFGLDATHQVRATTERIARLRQIVTPEAAAATELLHFATHLPANGPPEVGSPVHDPCPIAWLLQPELFEFRPCCIDVETDSRLTLGHTAVEFREIVGRPQNVRWAVKADAAGVFALLERQLDRQSQHRLSPKAAVR